MLFSKSVKTIGTIGAALVLMVSVSQANQFHFPALNQAVAAPSIDERVADEGTDQAILNRAEVSDSTLDEAMSPSELAKVLRIPSDSLFKARMAYTNRLTILVNKAQKGTSPTAQQMNVYLDGQLIQTFPVSTGRERPEHSPSGKDYFSSTPTGDFRIDWRAKNWVSQTWLAPMPYAQFFSGGVAIHATVPSHYKALGSRDSGGCVRLRLENAKIMWDLVDQVGASNVLIRVVDQAN
jgi:lipoprotein-anchoring transpeptidase ErfK/SrfK